MISKKSFCIILENIKNIEKKIDHLEKFLGHSICESDFFTYTATILDALGEDLKFKVCADFIFDFAYNHDWGNNGGVSVNIDGVDKTASNFEELYDLILDIVGNA